MPQMIRKQVYLTEDLNRRLRLLSQQQQKPEAEVIRETLEKGLKDEPSMSTGEALLGLAELGKRLNLTGPTDLSERHDDYLYGDNEE